MNGPQHYREAERLLPIAHDLADQGHQERAYFMVDRAQVHATLALAAATVASRLELLMEGNRNETICSDPAWNEVIQ